MYVVSGRKPVRTQVTVSETLLLWCVHAVARRELDASELAGYLWKL